MTPEQESKLGAAYSEFAEAKRIGARNLDKRKQVYTVYRSLGSLLTELQTEYPGDADLRERLKTLEVDYEDFRITNTPAVGRG